MTDTTKDPRKAIRIYLCCPDQPQLKKYLEEQLRTQGYGLVRAAKCTHALYVCNRLEMQELDHWMKRLDERAPTCVRWLCIPSMSTRQERTLGLHIKRLQPNRYDPEGIRARILGELYLNDPPQRLTDVLVGRSEALATLREQLERYAEDDSPVLLEGETGTGKELCTQLLHRLRGKGEQVSINCANLRKDLSGSELFGHRRGAFTGADAARTGVLVEAGHGTCFLDEVGEMELAVQASLLRVIDEYKVKPIGSNKYVPIHCRLVLATHRALEKRVESGDFREDLLHRIGYLRIQIPPLRERLEDIPLLVNHFIYVHNHKKGTKIAAPKGYDAFFNYHWPGNVRQLKGMLDSVMIGRKSGPLDMRSIEATIQRKQKRPKPEAEAIPFYRGVDQWADLSDRARKAFLEDALVRHGGINDQLLKVLACGKTKVYADIKHLGISWK